MTVSEWTSKFWRDEARQIRERAEEILARERDPDAEYRNDLRPLQAGEVMPPETWEDFCRRTGRTVGPTR